MTIESIKPDKFIIILDYDEASIYKLKHSQYSHAAIAYLLSLVSVKSGVALCSKKISVSPYSGKDRLYLVVTITPQLYLPEGNFCSITVSFSSLDVLFSAAEKVPAEYIKESSLYKKGSRYILVLKLLMAQSGRVMYLLSEYGEISTLTSLNLARIQEYGYNLIESMAIEKLKNL